MRSGGKPGSGGSLSVICNTPISGVDTGTGMNSTGRHTDGFILGTHRSNKHINPITASLSSGGVKSQCEIFTGRNELLSGLGIVIEH